jgi:hypothetical protein
MKAQQCNGLGVVEPGAASRSATRCSLLTNFGQDLDGMASKDSLNLRGQLVPGPSSPRLVVKQLRQGIHGEAAGRLGSSRAYGW